MHCWDCNKVINVPGRVIPKGKHSQTEVVDVTCNCGATFTVTTVRQMRQAAPMVDTRNEDEREKDRLWKNQE